jgi:hypothetical protein
MMQDLNTGFTDMDQFPGDKTGLIAGSIHLT